MSYRNNPLMEPVFFTPPGSKQLFKGGGGEAVKYDNLEKLYAEQASSARLLRGLAEANLPQVTTDYMSAVKEFSSPDYAEKQAGMASADLISANAMERAATDRSLASMGVNPNDPRFAASKRATEVSNAARMATGKNLARTDANKMRLAVTQDAVGTFSGQSNSAASQMSSASSGLSNLLNAQQQQKNMQAQQTSQNVGGAVAGGLALYSMFKDGGRVRPLEKHMLGGATGEHGFVKPAGMPTPPPAAAAPVQPQQSPVAQVSGGLRQVSNLAGKSTAQKGAVHMDKWSRMVQPFDKKLAQEIGAQGRGMALGPDQTKAAAEAYEMAAKEAADPQLAQQYADIGANLRAGAGLDQLATSAPVTATEVGSTAAGVSGEVAAAASGQGAAGAATGAATGAASGTAATTAAGTAAAEGLAATAGQGVSSAVAGMASGAGAAGSAATGAVSGAASSAAAMSTALPWIGAGIAAGSLLGLFADGGEVDTDGGAVDARDGTEVEGPGGHTDDVIPALLSDDEHVLNAEGAALLSHEKAEQLNKEGLALRKKGVTPDKIKPKYGLEVLA